MSSLEGPSKGSAVVDGRASVDPASGCPGGHIEDLRALMYCGICVKPLYEPFTLGCGHTFCYGCLTQWFGNDRRSQTCPDCRAAVMAEPAPAYLLRNIVHIFTGRAELLGKDETTAEHLQNQKAETERMERDKTNTDASTGGLFQGCFKRPMSLAIPIRDAEDGVDRCPECSWELEEGECLHCGFTLDLLSSSYMGSDGQGSVIMTDMADELDAEYMRDQELYIQNTFTRNGPPGSLDWPTSEAIRWNLDQFSGAISSDEESDEDYNSEMDDFIDDDIHHADSEGTDQGTVVGGNYMSDSSSPSRSGGSLADGGSIDGGHDTSSISGQPNATPGSAALEFTDDDDDDDDDDDEDDEPIRPPGRAVRQRPQASINSGRSGTFRASRSNGAPSGSTADNAISLDDDEEEDSRASRQRSRNSSHNQPPPRNRRGYQGSRRAGLD